MQTAVIALIVILLAIALRPYVVSLIETRDFQTCQSNVRAIARGMTMYTQEWDDCLPPAATWMDAAEGNLAPVSGTGFKTADYFRCPRDKSGAPSSFAYNSLLAGLSPTLRTLEPEAEQRRRRVRRLDTAPMIFERHGLQRNGSINIENWDGIRDTMTRPHRMPDPTGSLIQGGGRAWFRNDEQLATMNNKRF